MAVGPVSEQNSYDGRVTGVSCQPTPSEVAMTRTIAFVAALALLSGGAALAHHGWGSYDAAHPVTVTGAIQTLKYENPHALITVKGSDKVWTVTLAPTFRMDSRGASEKVVAVGEMVQAYGYPSNVDRNE